MMNKNDYHYVMRRIITFIIISALTFFFATSCVHAQTYNLPRPTITYNKYTGGTVSESASDSAWWNISMYTSNNYYLGDVGSSGEIYTLAGFHFTNANLCSNKTMLISFELGGLFDFYTANSYVNVYNNGVQLSCSYTQTDSSRRRYTCSGLGGGEFLVIMGLNTIQTRQSYSVGIQKGVDLICDSGNDAVIVNNNQNTDRIINNQNNNTQSIINNQNNNTQQEINHIDSNTQAINDLNDSINADYQSDTSWYSDFEGVTGNNTNYLKTLLLYPTNLLISIANAVINNTCSQIDLGTLWGVHLYLPCINWKTYVGNAIYISIDTIMGIAVLFGIITYIRKLFVYVADFGMSAYESVAVEVFK